MRNDLKDNGKRLQEMDNGNPKATYIVFDSPNVSVLYGYLIEKKDYFYRGLYSGNFLRYEKKTGKVEVVNAITFEIKTVEHLTFKVIAE